MHTLILHPRYDDDSQLLWQEAIRRKWDVVRLDGYRVPESLFNGGIRRRGPIVYGGHMWALEIAGQLGIRRLLSLPLDWLTKQPQDTLGRTVRITTLGEAIRPVPMTLRGHWRPAFVKSLHWPQEFASRVYHSPDDLPALGGDIQVLASEPVIFAREFRAFVLDGKVLAFSPYSRGPEGTLDAQLSREDAPVAERCCRWLAEVLPRLVDLPRAAVIDVGVLDPRRGHGSPVLVEANPAWCSGLYACDPAGALDVVAAASEPA